MFKCPKCGSEDIPLRYREKDINWVESSNHLVCKCKRCEYLWREIPLDEREDETDQG